MKKMKNKLLNIFILIAALCAICLTGCKTSDDNIINETAEEIAVNTQITEEPEKAAEPSKVEQYKAETEEQPASTETEKATENAVDEKATDKAETQEKNFCTLSVDCKIILSNMDMLKKEKQSCVPEDGVIFAEKPVEFDLGETVFDLLLREMQNSKIHMEFVETPMYKSMYIKAINNLYEFDCGELSGWTYRVNGEQKNVGCSQCILQPGDKVEWIYSCDLGRDID